MATKIGAGRLPQTYNTDNGFYGKMDESVAQLQVEQYKKKIKNTGKKCGLKKKEINAINRYVNSFDDGWYRKINETLREGKKLRPEDEAICKSLDSALDKMPKYKGQLLRTINIPEDKLPMWLKQHQVGDTIVFDAYTSTTKGSERQAKGNVDFVIINSHNGSDLSAFNPIQQEILYKRGSKFNVTNYKIKNSRHILYIEEI